MIVSSTEVQNNFGQYLGLVGQEDIIITRNGKKVARLVKYHDDYEYVIHEGVSDYTYEGMEVSYEEFLKIARESENRYEYIDGEIYLLASPKYKHQKIVVELSSIMLSWFKDKNCQPLVSPFDVTLYKNDQSNVVQPDILVICDHENIEEDNSYMGTPALVVEVLSKSTRSKDVIKKLDLYMQGGVQEYWVVNPFSEEVTIYYFEKREIEKLVTFKKEETAESSVFEGLKVEAKEVFS